MASKIEELGCSEVLDPEASCYCHVLSHVISESALSDKGGVTSDSDEMHLYVDQRARTSNEEPDCVWILLHERRAFPDCQVYLSRKEHIRY